MTPFHLVARNGNLDVVKYLCEKGSDIEAKPKCKSNQFYLLNFNFVLNDILFWHTVDWSKVDFSNNCSNFYFYWGEHSESLLLT